MIPTKERDILERDPRMRKCVSCGTTRDIQWHHAVMYRGKRIQKAWAIQPLCIQCHTGNSGSPLPYAAYISEIASLVMATEADLREFPKLDKYRRKNELENKIKYL